MKLARVNKRKMVIIIAITFILILSIINIKGILSSSNVLGTTTSNISESDFWSTFLKSNPNYIPGLIETGNTTKADQIDPNFVMKLR